MCLILLAYEAHPTYNLVLAANRDEFYERPTAPAAVWEDRRVLGGRDLQHGGTWLGMTDAGRLAAVTNFRDPHTLKTSAPSRGALVRDFLRGDHPPREYLAELATHADQYNGFNLIVGSPYELCFYSNRSDDQPRALTSGIYGLSNHLLDTPWPKVVRGKAALAAILGGSDRPAAEDIFTVLADHAPAPDEELPRTGVGLEVERALSPLFISTPIYGTRSSTVLLVDREQHVTFVERTFTADSSDWQEVSYRFKIGERYESDSRT